jgi:hypothetical protein
MADRRDYHRQYYQKRKELNLVTSPPKHFPKHFPKVEIVQYVFLFTSTIFLIVESAEFYKALDTSFFSPYIKSILGESSILIFATLSSRSRVRGFFYKFLMCWGVLLSTYSFSAGIYQKYRADKTQHESTQTIVENLQQRLAGQRQLLDFYLKKDWPTTVNRINNATNELNRELKVEIQQLSTTQQAALADFIALVLLRILIQLTNIFIIMREGKNG